ncbi:MAG: transglycosylase domain-containing protein [Prolixibacteraceae bacterium]|nr:transglycosylase domain-containing protein [Prolixibacteraceae bacterium]MDI9564152.1 transglycosylase domain-containing protein [Bacteroidota bacterium]NLS99093.1 penicillin-binding protein [Bacteroidales bacterium]OQB79577.1 MAG: Penicillin-binding protein 1A [Bacteroidetes bacterium ADurb.Bin123]HNZ69250.1 transglycosylase domain-containing protein [Prolixibacteraceae bacterium]
MNDRKKATSKRSGRSAGPGKKFRWGRFFLKLFAAGIILLFLLFFTVYLGFLGKVPSKAELVDVKTPLASEVISADGKLLGRYYTENRSYAAYDEISRHIINALVATEDARFFKHRGIDEIALFRVFFKTILFFDRSSGGGSTLSQQIAKNLFPRERYGLISLPVNKIREAIIAYRLERIYSKEEILTLYLNTVPFGENIYGIELAAERFFSKPPSQITIPEAAVLVGMLKANNVFNPRLHPDRALERRNVVLDQMVRQKFIPEADVDIYKKQPLNLRYSLITYNQGPAPYFLEHIRPALMDWCIKHTKPDGSAYNLYTDGLKIYTTVDYNLQRYARNAVSEQMKQLQALFDKHWENRDPWGTDKSVVERAIRRTDRYRKGIANGRSHREMMDEFARPIETTLFTWEGLKAVKTTPLDSVKHYLSMLNAGVVVMENKTGAVKAWVGGIDYRFFKYDYCMASRQTGSTFKPFIYLAALENGYSPTDYFSAEEQTYDEYDGWTPGNASDRYQGYYNMKTALAKSINTVTVDIFMQTGIHPTVRTVRNLGINSELPEVPSLALGVASVPLQEMVTAYATIVNEGKQLKPYSLLSIENSKGEQLDIFDIPAPGRSKVDPENCRILVDMLKTAVDQGTGFAIRSTHKIPGEFAGKTGTTQENADGWFIGCTPDLTAGCWVGADDPAVHFRTMTYGQGAYQALPVIGRFFSQMYSDSRFRPLSENRFAAPDSLTLAQINEMPGHIETLEEDFNFFDIFRKREDRRKGRGDPKKEDAEESSGKKFEKGEPAWEIIKKIFRKK